MRKPITAFTEAYVLGPRNYAKILSIKKKRKKMDKLLRDEINKTYPNVNSSYRLNKKKISEIAEGVHIYSWFAALDEVIEILRENKSATRDEIIGFIHLLAQEKLGTIKGISYYKAKSMENLNWLINFTEEGKL